MPEATATDSNGAVTVNLTRPVTVNGNTYDSLSLAVPTVANQLEIEDEPSLAKKEIKLVSLVARVPLEVIMALSLPDYALVQRAIQDFLSPPTVTNSATRSLRSAARRAGASQK